MNMLPAILATLLFLSACGGGSAEARAQYEQAVKMLQGVGVAQDTEKGLVLLRKAAAGKNPEAEVMLGFFLMKGDSGVEQDQKKAMQLFLDAARQGNRDAQYNAGLAFVRAQGTEENYESAVRWFTAAALQNDPGAQYNLGVMYLSGEGTVKDALTAYAWFSIAKENGFEGAEEAKASARKEMTSDEAKNIDSTIASLKSKIVKPKDSGIRLESHTEQSL